MVVRRLGHLPDAGVGSHAGHARDRAGNGTGSSRSGGVADAGRGHRSDGERRQRGGRGAGRGRAGDRDPRHLPPYAGHGTGEDDVRRRRRRRGRPGAAPAWCRRGRPPGLDLPAHAPADRHLARQRGGQRQACSRRRPRPAWGRSCTRPRWAPTRRRRGRQSTSRGRPTASRPRRTGGRRPTSSASSTSTRPVTRRCAWSAAGHRPDPRRARLGADRLRGGGDA